MLDEGLTTAVKGFTDANPVLGGVIILLMILNVLTYKIMEKFRKEAEDKLAKEQEAHNKTRAEQREDYRNMSNVTKSVEDLQLIVRETLRKNA